ncbi:putative ABC transporter (type 2), permease protein [Desulfosarcina variabilis str. Montpellier]|uniref:ABC transporter permease n=1 Tax=Desulfosarcina variabilis TaxID=2300 RepID=UPI003AFB18D9
MITALFAVIQKEFLLLLRDKAGLLVLFVMPAVLVVVITLVQENAMKTIGESDTRILLIDEDGEALGRQITEALEEAEGVVVTRTLEGHKPGRDEALAMVAKGAYQLCLIIPADMTEQVRASARQSALQSISDKAATVQDKGDTTPTIEVHFDPTVLGGFRSAVRNMLALMVFRIQVSEKMAALADVLPAHIDQTLAEALKPAADFLPEMPQTDLKLEWSEAALLNIESQDALAGNRLKLPTSVQQNVPAWSLFGIFFIVLPMAGAFIQERINGTYLRLLAMPVGYLTLVSGRIIAYMGVCLAQCVLIGCIGKWILPLWGTPPLEIGGDPVALGVMAASAIFAATGYGILLGTVVNSFEQAAMFGPISIVIAAALGGVMVPVYAMPTFMQTISVISPLAWGLNGTLDVFVRGGGARDVLPEAAALGTFFVACVLLAWVWQRQRRSGAVLA